LFWLVKRENIIVASFAIDVAGYSDGGFDFRLVELRLKEL